MSISDINQSGRSATSTDKIPLPAAFFVHISICKKNRGFKLESQYSTELGSIEAKYLDETPWQLQCDQHHINTSRTHDEKLAQIATMLLLN